MAMDKKIIFVKTAKAEMMAAGISGDLKRALLLIDGKSTLDEVARRAPPSLRAVLDDTLEALLAEGLIQDKDKPVATVQIVKPKAQAAMNSGEELDFTSLVSPTPAARTADDKAARAHAELEAAVAAAKEKARQDAEAKAEANARLAAEAAAKGKAEIEQRVQQETAIREQAEAKARQEAAARVRAEQAAEQARQQLEAAAKAKAETEAQAQRQIEAAARAKAEAELQAKREIEAARQLAEKEAARVQAELAAAAQAKEQAEAARLKAEQEAARVKAELEAQRIKQEAETARLKAEQEAARLKAEQEAARLKAEQEAARQKAEQEAERIRAQAEIRAKQEAEKIRAEAEARAKEEAARLQAEQEASRIKAQQEAERIRAEAEAQAKQEAEKIRAEAKTRAQQEAASLREKMEQEKTQARAEAELKATLEARARQEAEVARQKAEQDNVRIKAELEAAKLQAASVGDKTDKQPNFAAAEAAAAKAAQEAQQLAAEQAKAWAAAEQRAREQARQEAERPAQPAAEPVRPAAPASAKVRRKPLPLGKIAAGLLVVAVLLVFALPYVMPLDSYIAPIEQRLSAQFGQPVHIAKLHASSLPVPSLQLEQVQVGEAHEGQAGKVVLTFDVASLFGQVKKISNAELQDVSLAGQSLDKLQGWLQRLGNDNAYPVQRVTIKQLQIVGSDLALPAFNGAVDLDPQGKIAQVKLLSADGKIDLALHPVEERWQVELDAKGTGVPLFNEVNFEDFSAKGELSAAVLNFPEFKAQLYGGFLNGKLKLEWQRGWAMRAEMEASSVELDKLFPKFGVSGELSGNARLNASAARFDKLSESKTLEGRFKVGKGEIKGFDMIETARQGNTGAGGRTYLDELGGDFQSSAQGSHFQRLQIASGILSSRGAFDVNGDGSIAGRFSAELKGRSGTSNLSLSGTLSAPQLRAAR